MTKLAIRPVMAHTGSGRILTWIALAFSLVILSAPASAQQTGDISGQVTSASGTGIADVAVEASSNILPQRRTTRTADNGRYRFHLLPPGDYELKFSFADGDQQTRRVRVLLQQTAKIDIAQGSGADMEEIIVTGSQLLAETGQGSLKNALSAEMFDALPVGQDYRDLMKLIPGVMYSENEVRGPSAGGSGQDNTYQFDGVDVSLPLFGVLSSEPSTHDIAQVSVVRGGAKAVGFNRSGGFLMNTVSKRGTDEFRAEVSYQIQSSSMTSDLDTGGSLAEFEEDRTWSTLSLGGPIVSDRLYFYTSYYRPDHSKSNIANAYGAVGDFENIRDEFFGKLTFAPTDSILLDASFRTSEREKVNDSVGEFEAPTASLGSTNTQDILILEGSWIISDESSFSFKVTDFETQGIDRPDTPFDFTVTPGDSLNVAALDQVGYFNVPQLIIANPLTAEDIAFNAFAQPLIDQYGYSLAGVQTGGGAVGGYFRIDDVAYFRDSFELAFDHLIYAGNTTHDIHVGYQFMENKEDLARRSNGWGSIVAPGGTQLATDGVTPVFFEARVQQQTLIDPSGANLVPSIVSSSELQSFEINDSIEIGDWTYNIGVMISNDVLYGQGLAPDASNPITGLVASPGTKYKMYEVDWSDMIQPRLGANWDYSDAGSVYFNYARYNPSASSLARAASWDRNLRSRIDVRFDAAGNFIEMETLDSSSGKWFQDGLTPRHTDEFLIGTTRNFSDGLTLRAHVRHRKSKNFWEDTNNAARIDYLPHPGAALPGDIPQELYVPNLADIVAEIGSGSSFVIAELDGGLTKFWEASFEADWNRDKWFLSGSYTWSHYYGNFDQDTTTTSNDQATFIGSSNIGDFAGRQLWNFKWGNLGGDRRHKLKMYGFYDFDWSGRAGAYLVFQSGEPWEAWDSNFYRSQTGSTSDTIRFAEPAGSRTTGSHWQLDLNYTHNFAFADGHNIQLRADVFNVFDNQTGYSIQRKVNSSGFGEADRFFKPRRFQLAVKYQFN